MTAPQCTQNAAPGGFSRPQLLHVDIDTHARSGAQGRAKGEGTHHHDA
jgi:hypothetical protein